MNEIPQEKVDAACVYIDEVADAAKDKINWENLRESSERLTTADAIAFAIQGVYGQVNNNGVYGWLWNGFAEANYWPLVRFSNNYLTGELHKKFYIWLKKAEYLLSQELNDLDDHDTELMEGMDDSFYFFGDELIITAAEVIRNLKAQ